MEKTNQQDCEICYRISCRECGWIATDVDVMQIQKGELIACPICGWKPGEKS